ncbi:hypothetical protein SAMN05660742_10696 [Propionispira arboris]|uniref:Uncharacterized protein n=1 Tax=Propionispira arboris TaxID=84035 RepID=A0A1H6Y3E7_9FIRM|nr:hypothetical protein [Propionispira arboris]SEJ35799.1 hypothetical protein SAMN05660742_10696 [Propionispira arboris]
MMDTIGKLKQIRDYMNSSPFPKPEFGDACDEAIKALDHKQFSKHKIEVLEQENEILTKRSQWALEEIVKYEKALEIMSDKILGCSGCPNDSIEKRCNRNDCKIWAKYQAGLDVD